MNATTYRESDRVRLVRMPNDPDPVPAGMEGTVVHVTDLSCLEAGQVQVGVAWDNGRILAAVCPPDELEPVTTTVRRYAVRCQGGGQGLFADCPALAVFEIRRPLAEFIVRMATLVQANGLTKVEKTSASAWWLERDPRDADADADADDCPINPATLSWASEDEMRSECDHLVVTDRAFSFTCYRRHGDDLIETVEQPIAELARHFAIPFDAPADRDTAPSASAAPSLPNS